MVVEGETSSFLSSSFLLAVFCVNLTTLLAAAGIDAAALGLTSVGTIVGILFEVVVGLRTAETASGVLEVADIGASVAGMSNMDAFLSGLAKVGTIDVLTA